MASKGRPQPWHRIVAMCLIMLAVSGGLAYLFLKVDLIPNPASVERGLIDNFLKLLFAIAGVFFVVIVTVGSYALLFFRRRTGDDTDAQASRGSLPLELTWTLIPLAIVVALGVYGTVVLDRMEAPPRTTDPALSEIRVDVTAFRFGWLFEYPALGIRSVELGLPVDRPVLFRIRSLDVVHSFWVQEFGPKQDAVPGMTTELRITPTKTGNFQVICSQLCGSGHTSMVAPVSVVSAGDFERWVRVQQSTTPAPTGEPGPGPGTMVALSALNMSFNADTITVPAGAGITINFSNQDTGIPHNFAVYDSPALQKTIFQGKVITGPSTIVYQFMAPMNPGTYFFRCDVHGTTMTGRFVVQ